MIRRPLGSSGLEVSLIGYGAWKAGKIVWDGIEERSSIYAMQYAMDQGINFFDTAPGYGFGTSEHFLGRAVKGRREDVVIATKVGKRWDKKQNITKHLGKDSILWEIEQSLKRLDVDVIDLIQIHWNDHKTPMEEVMEAFLQAREQGKVRFFGACNLGLKNLETLQNIAPLASVQVLYNMLDRNRDVFMDQELEYRTEAEIVPFCKQNEVGFIPFCPLARSWLTESRDPLIPESRPPYWKVEDRPEVFRQRDAFAHEAREQGLSLSAFALEWLARKSFMSSIIISSTTPEHIKDNCRVIEKLNARGLL
jgi:aryl-alcohol dehydrogenase-like predicted oxidoreductase